MTPQDQLTALTAALMQLRGDTINTRAFSDLAQQQSALTAALPLRYAEVLSQLLTRLESSALFTDESCSFSRNDLIDGFQAWIEKAAQQLEKSTRENS